MKTLVLASTVVMVFASGGAWGQDYNQVDFSSQANWTWAGFENAPTLPVGVFLPGAPTGMTTLGGVPFDIKSNNSGYQAWNAYLAANEGTGQVSLTTNVNVYGVTNVYTLINTFWGPPGPDAYTSLIFTGSDGATYTKPLIGLDDIRDYNGTAPFNGTTTVNVFSGPDIGGITGVLDMQRITLPPAFANQTLTTIELVDNGARGLSRAILDGVTVQTPEPSTVVLGGIGLIGLLGMAVRRCAADGGRRVPKGRAIRPIEA